MDPVLTRERAEKYFGGVLRDGERILAVLRTMQQSEVVVKDFYATMDKLGESDKNAVVANFNAAIKLLARPENSFVSLPAHRPEFYSASSVEKFGVDLNALNSGRAVVEPHYVMQRVDEREEAVVDARGKHGTGFEDVTSMQTICAACGKPVDGRRQIAADKLYHFGCLMCAFCARPVLDVFPSVSSDHKVGHEKCVADASRRSVA